MLYDLNIQWSASTPEADLDRILRFAKAVGYDVVALNRVILPPVKDATNTIPVLSASHPSYPQQNLTRGDVSAKASPSSSSSSPAASTLPMVLRRATIVVSDTSANYRFLDHARAYDLLAVRPTTNQAFTWACSSQEVASIISVDMAQRLEFYFMPKSCMAAVSRGVHFEIAYGQVIGATASSQARANFIGNVQGLLRATKGRGVFVSSEARSALGLRGPADVVNLLAVWGLGTEKGLEALRGIPRSIVVNEGIQKRGFRGVIDIVEPARRELAGDGEDVEMKDAERESGGKGRGKKGGKSQKQQKRAAGDDDNGASQPMSKRQAKKMRKEAAQASESAKQ